MHRFLAAIFLLGAGVSALHAEIIVAEGESFQVPAQDKNGWRVTHQNDSYGSHTYGGMWMTHGGCLGAPAAASSSLAWYSWIFMMRPRTRVCR